MDKFREKLRIKTMLFGVAALGVSIIYFVLQYFSESLPNTADFSEFFMGYQAGCFGGVELVFLFFILRNVICLTSDERLKRFYIKSTDERTLMIHQKSKAVAAPIIVIGLAIAIIVAGFFSQTVFFTLLITYFSVAAVVLALKLYYTLKLG